MQPHAQDYDELINDIKVDAGNYCTPKVMRLSMKDRKASVQQALSDWDKIQLEVTKALSTKKSYRLQQSLSAISQVMWRLETKMSEVEVQLARRREYEASLAGARCGLDRVARDAARQVQLIAEELRVMHEDRKEEHLRALLRGELPHWGQTVSGPQLADVRRAIAERLEGMVANDMFARVELSSALSMLWEIMGSFSLSDWIRGAPASVSLVGSLASALAAAAASKVFALFGGPMLAFEINEAFVTQEVDAYYNDILSRVEEDAMREYQGLLSSACAEVETQERLLGSLKAADLQELVNEGFTSTFSELGAEYQAVSRQCQVTLDDVAVS